MKPFLDRKNEHPFGFVQLEEVEEVEEVEDDFLSEEGMGDDDAGSDNFDLERGRRSLASIFDSDEDSVVQVDSSQQDESLLVRTQPPAAKGSLVQRVGG